MCYSIPDSCNKHVLVFLSDIDTFFTTKIQNFVEYVKTIYQGKPKINLTCILSIVSLRLDYHHRLHQDG